MLRPLLLALVLSAPASAQVRVAYEVAPIAISGNVFDYGFGSGSLAGRDSEESAGGSHRSLSATVPVAALGDGLAVRAAYTTFTDEDTGETSAFPGVFVVGTFASEGVGLGGVGSMEIGYDYYNREAFGVLGLIPTIGASLGPRIGLGPVAVEATVGAQVTSILQGVALTARVGVAIGG